MKIIKKIGDNAISSISSEYDEKVTKTREVLEATFTAPITQKRLSLKIGINEGKMRRGFKQYYGVTIHEYITKLRMEMAVNLLIFQNKDISEISYMVGFSHQNNFSNAFKRYFKSSPNNFRKKLKAGQIEL
jgi:AraC-like DNA-binding protein